MDSDILQITIELNNLLDNVRNKIWKISEKGYDDRKAYTDEAYGHFSAIYGVFQAFQSFSEFPTDVVSRFNKLNKRLYEVNCKNMNDRIAYVDEFCSAGLELYGFMKGILVVELLKIQKNSETAESFKTSIQQVVSS